MRDREIENKIQLQSKWKGEGRNSKGIITGLVSDESFFLKYIQRQTYIFFHSSIFYSLYSILDRDPNGLKGVAQVLGTAEPLR